MASVNSKRSDGYQPVGQNEDGTSSESSPQYNQHPNPHFPGNGASKRSYKTFALAFLTSLILCLGLGLATGDGSLFGIRRPGAECGQPWWDSEQSAASNECPCRVKDVPQYFETEIPQWRGPTATGKAPFLAQTMTFDPTATYEPNAPLRTAIPIEGMSSQNTSIFQMLGYVDVFSPRKEGTLCNVADAARADI
jgi:hypothetical protein